MIPLTVTILFIYSLLGFMGKDYDMPVAVLSALTLGLSIDFAIHFIQRARDIFARCGSWKETSPALFKEPAKAIEYLQKGVDSYLISVIILALHLFSQLRIGKNFNGFGKVSSCEHISP